MVPFRPLLVAMALSLSLSAPAFAQAVGVTAAVNQSATGTLPQGAPRTMLLGDNVIHDQKIVTDGKGLLQILLADGTSFTVGPNSSIVIDSFVYDPDAGTAKVAATLGTGLFRFIGGQTSKTPDGVTLNTPVGTVGIQGGIANLDFSGSTARHLDLLYGVQLTLRDGTQVVGNVYQSGYSIVIDPSGKVSVVKTPPEWTQAFQTAMAGNRGPGGTVGGGGTGGGTPSDTGTPPDIVIPPTPPGGDTQTNLVATWDDMENSPALDTSIYAFLYYTGNFAGTYVDANTKRDFTDAEFELHFNPGARLGGISFYKYWEDAGFGFGALISGDPDAPASAPATFENCLCEGGPDGTISGAFLNTPQGLGTGVTGTVDVDVGHSEASSYHVTGTFAGNYQGSLDDD